MHSRHIKFSPLNAHRSVPTGGSSGCLCLALGLYTPSDCRWRSCSGGGCSCCCTAATVSEFHISLDGRPFNVGRHAVVRFDTAVVLGCGCHRQFGQCNSLSAQQQSADNDDQLHHQSEWWRRRWGRNQQQQQLPQLQQQQFALP